MPPRSPSVGFSPGGDVVPVQILKQDVITTSQKIVVKMKAVKDANSLPKPLHDLALKVTNKSLTAAQKTQICDDFGDQYKNMSFFKVTLTEKGKATDYNLLDKKLEEIAPAALKLFIYEGDAQYPKAHTLGGIYWLEDKALSKLDSTLFSTNSLVIQKEGDEQKEVINALKSCLKLDLPKPAQPAK